MSPRFYVSFAKVLLVFASSDREARVRVTGTENPVALPGGGTLQSEERRVNGTARICI